MAKIIHNGITYAGIPDIDYDCEITTVTLYAANWSNGVYTITDSRIDSTSVQEYLPGLGITDDQLAALQSANIHDNGQDAGHAYLKAYGDIPEIDIPIRVMFNPGVKTKEIVTEFKGRLVSIIVEHSENSSTVTFTNTYVYADHTSVVDVVNKTGSNYAAGTLTYDERQASVTAVIDPFNNPSLTITVTQPDGSTDVIGPTNLGISNASYSFKYKTGF